MPFFTASILISLGFIPSLVWLALFLRKDCHPEPKSLLIKTFLLGIVIAPLVILLQWLASYLFSSLGFTKLISQTFSFFIWGAFIEEYMKYWAVKVSVLQNPEFDEPPDAMIYLIAAALGFAAIENILILFNVVPDGATQAISVWALRFTGATLLHALASAIVGFFLGLSWFYDHHKKKFLAAGIFIASIFHLIFNLVIFLEFTNGFFYNLVLLSVMISLVVVMFNKIRKHHLNYFGYPK